MSKPLVLTPQHFGSLVFDRRSAKYHPFDQEATALLMALAERPLRQVLKDLPQEAQAQCWRFFTHFEGLGFFTVSQTLAGEVNTPPVVPEGHLTGPLAVHLEVASACNLTCSHCFAGALPRKERYLTLQELDGLFATLSQMGCFRVGLTGGEPLLRKDLFAIIDLALAHGLHPSLTTNGLLITEDIARAFGERELVWLNVSLDGSVATTNDHVRGGGSFDRVLEKLELLGRHACFSLAFTVMQHNLDEIEACARLAASVGAESAVFRPLYPAGLACGSLEELPSYRQYHDAIQALSVLAEGKGAGSFEAFGAATRAHTSASVITNTGCGAGNWIASVSASGQVNPCSFLGDDYDAGSLRKQSFDQIWHTSQGFQSIRSLPGGTEETFSGGCRARSLVMKGGINAPDPWLEERRALQASAGGQTWPDPMQTFALSSPTKP